jgi:hypothetical protein
MPSKSGGEKSKTESFSSLSDKALEDLKDMGRAAIVCGPITTGGYDSVKDNIKVFETAINLLKSRGLKVFNQVPYEPLLWKLKDRWKKAGNTGYCTPILTDFYLPLYRSGHIYKAYFLPGWESSFGAKWERKELKALGIEIIDFDNK